MENNIWDSPTAKKAVEAYQAKWTSTHAVRQAKLHQEVSRILGVTVQFPVTDEVIVDGIKFFYVNSSNATKDEPTLRVQIENFVCDTVRSLADLGGFIMQYDEARESLG